MSRMKKKPKPELKSLKAKSIPNPTGPEDLVRAMFAVADKELKKRRVNPKKKG